MQTLSSLISEPTQNDRKAFASVAGGNAPAMIFTRDQLKLIADALMIAEVHFTSRSEWFGKVAATSSVASKRIKATNLADRIFCQGCDARDLSEKISAELRRTRA